MPLGNQFIRDKIFKKYSGQCVFSFSGHERRRVYAALIREHTDITEKQTKIALAVRHKRHCNVFFQLKRPVHDMSHGKPLNSGGIVPRSALFLDKSRGKIFGLLIKLPVNISEQRP